MNTTTEIDVKVYGRLLARTLPTVIKTAEENLRMLAIVDKLMAKGEENLTPEEDALLELLIDLIHDYEEKDYPFPKSEPRKMVAFLLEQRGMTASELWPVLGSKGRTSELLSGKRGISKDQARKLAAFFNAPISLFI